MKNADRDWAGIVDALGVPTAYVINEFGLPAGYDDSSR